MATPKVYVICDQNCKFESMTKEQILAAIIQAVNEGTVGDIDAGFITTIKTINGLTARFFIGEQSAYDALSDDEKENLFKIITNDTTIEGINEAFEKLQQSQTDLEYCLDEIIKGEVFVGYAKTAAKANNDDLGRSISNTYKTKKESFYFDRATIDKDWVKGFANKIRVGYVNSRKTIDDIVAVSLKVYDKAHEKTDHYYALKTNEKATDENGEYVEFVCVQAWDGLLDGGWEDSKLTIRIYDIEGTAYITLEKRWGISITFNYNGELGNTLGEMMVLNYNNGATLKTVNLIYG